MMHKKPLDKDVSESFPRQLLPEQDVAQKAVERWKKRLERAQSSMAAQLEVSGNDIFLQNLAQWLVANQRLCPRGTSSCILPDCWGGTGVRRKLDPALDAKGNAAVLFKEAARMRRRRLALPLQLERIRQEAKLASSWEERLRDAPHGEKENRSLKCELETLRDILVPRGLWPTPKRRNNEDVFPLLLRPQPLAPGWVFLAGRSGRENDLLTGKLTRSGDIWLHAAHVPGAHVILRGDGRTQPPAEILEQAAGIALWLSRSRNQSQGDVHWTLRKHVRKPRKAPPGLVVLEHFQTVRTRPTPPPTPILSSPSDSPTPRAADF